MCFAGPGKWSSPRKRDTPLHIDFSAVWMFLQRWKSLRREWARRDFIVPKILLDAVDHAKILHPDDPKAVGMAILACRDGERWKEHAVSIRDLPYVARYLLKRQDVYISQNRFDGRFRRISTLKQLNALWVDLDYYRNPELAGLHPWKVLELVLELLEREGIPAPSFAVATGRGLALVWLHSPVPRAALPRWNACQQRLYEVLKELGADPMARDAARVLRLIGTINSKTGSVVEALTPAEDPWPFDRLADAILPLSRAEIRDLRVARALRGKTLVRPPQAFTEATLWEARLSDLQKLLWLRWFGRLPPGQRDAWLFIAGVAMSWLCIPQVLQRELFALAHEVGGWDEKEAKTRLHAVLKRAHMAARGETVEWMGQRIDPRYRFTNETIIEWLQITPEEQEQLSVIKDEKGQRELNRLRQERFRREAGALPREEYLARAEMRRQEVLRLRQEGMSIRQIAEKIGLSKSQVHRILSGKN